MNRIAIILALLSAFAGHVMAADCNAKAEKTWSPDPKLNFTVEALTTGKSCDMAVALLIVRNEISAPVYTFVAPVEQVAMLAKDHRTSGQTMEQALAEWIGLDGSRRKPDFLLAWPEAQTEAPMKQGEEFPFTVSDQIGRDDYEEARKSGKFLFCFVAGMESEVCLSARDADTVTEMGYQSFPG